LLEIKPFESLVEANLAEINVLALGTFESNSPDGFGSTDVALVIFVQNVLVCGVVDHKELLY